MFMLCYSVTTLSLFQYFLGAYFKHLTPKYQTLGYIFKSVFYTVFLYIK